MTVLAIATFVVVVAALLVGGVGIVLASRQRQRGGH
jgi:hypothetical protein